MEKNFDIQGSVTPDYLDYLANHGRVCLEDFANAMNVSVTGLKVVLGSIERDANGEYGSSEKSLGADSWATVFKLTRPDGVETVEIVRPFYDEYLRRRDAKLRSR